MIRNFSFDSRGFEIFVTDFELLISISFNRIDLKFKSVEFFCEVTLISSVKLNNEKRQRFEK